MSNWKNFEIECVDYLTKNYTNDEVKFKLIGESDSTISDIEVLKNDETLFFIEVKMATAQSGQFVVHYDDEKFYFSNKNKSDEDQITKLIIQELNNNFQFYKKNDGFINLDKTIFQEWIINNYKHKNVKYIISKYKHKFIIFPLENLGDYFNITAKYRVKKSGSSSLPKKYLSLVSDFFDDQIVSKGKRIYLITDKPLRKQYNIDMISIQLTRKEKNIYEIRKLSNTYNRNVIFSIEIKNGQNIDDLTKFISDIE